MVILVASTFASLVFTVACILNGSIVPPASSLHHLAEAVGEREVAKRLKPYWW